MSVILLPTIACVRPILDAGKSLDITGVEKFFHDKNPDFASANKEVHNLQPLHAKLSSQAERLKCFAPYKSGNDCGHNVKDLFIKLSTTIAQLKDPQICSMRFHTYVVHLRSSASVFEPSHASPGALKGVLQSSLLYKAS